MTEPTEETKAPEDVLPTGQEITDAVIAVNAAIKAVDALDRLKNGKIPRSPDGTSWGGMPHLYLTRVRLEEAAMYLDRYATDGAVQRWIVKIDAAANWSVEHK